ncbi:unnamed protein product [Sphenostylis stenocarpa]|uniref:Uncharacterized protein n=1 Tax=Sphenostylis stenocarpa TaxID=92480 RepID=A0AA86VU41_9FABA|nr:unnamed protein product [Sphenostylis stenocarpa]
MLKENHKSDPNSNSKKSSISERSSNPKSPPHFVNSRRIQGFPARSVAAEDSFAR